MIKLPTRREAAQSVGISLHAALEEVEKAGGVAQTGLDGALALLASRWEGEGFATPEDEAEARKKAEALLSAYLARYGEGVGKPVMIEKKLEAPYAGVPFLGIVDRVDRLPDGSLELIDYKSGRALITTAVKQQLAIYRYLVEATTGELPRAVAIHHLATGAKLPVELPAAEWRGLLDGAAEGARAIEAEEDFDPQTGRHCDWCDFKHRCPAYKREHNAT
ncbi:MAG: recombinase RecB [Cyanobacteria bacterium RYN_339]|nr:recombinase RecB [Cyanobacteria bacterium RYN_339]